MKRLVILFGLLAVPALAQENETVIHGPLKVVVGEETPRGVDMTKIVTDANGKPVPDPTDRAADDKDCAKCPPLTVGAIVSLALNGSYEDEKTLPTQQRYDRAFLAKRIRADPNASLDGTELGKVELLLGKTGINGQILLQVIDTIDPKFKPGKVQ